MCGRRGALSERSEFGRRAAHGEEHGAPVRLYRTGSRQATAVLVTFAKTKVTRAARRGSSWSRDSVVGIGDS
ncbi:hypothetical protein XHV734_4372 [Xanthomonas hortorum pv. vitians]|nr:hypothetical protein XHV734_4372 [Xanthomonas hortorum pv. vitians]